MANEKILIVDDNEEIQELITLYLKEEHYQYIAANTGMKAISLAQTTIPDLIILDIFLPDIDGYEVCQQLRKFTNVPILFLSSKNSETDKIVGLRVGGDDYITKPFSPGELLARINAHLRRNRILHNVKQGHVLKYKNLEINTTSHVVKLNESDLQLSTKEFQLLSLLAENPNRVFSLQMLFDLVWSEESLGDTRTVTVHISNLRKKIEKDPTKPKFILTVRGIGYKFNGEV